MPRIFSRFAQVMRLRRRRTVKQTAKLDDVPPSLPIDSVLFAGSVHHQGDDGPVERAVSPPPATSATNCTNANTTAAAQREVTTVESLPAELRSRILSHLTNDLGGLSALVLASPVFYQQYLLERPALLRAGLKTALGNVVADAYAVRASARLYKPLAPDSPAHVDVDAETIKLFIDKHVTVLRLATPDQILQEYCTENDLMRMAAFYYSLARPLSLKLAIRFLSRLNPSLEAQGKLSTTESTRLLRALYRWQLYCNLFGPGPEMMRRRKVAQLEHGTHLDILFCLFKPWEIEEVYCIWVLLRDTYRGVADSVTWDLNRDHPRFRDWPNPLALGSWDLGNECELSVYFFFSHSLLPPRSQIHTPVLCDTNASPSHLRVSNRGHRHERAIGVRRYHYGRRPRRASRADAVLPRGRQWHD